MKHALELFERPIPILRTPEAGDSPRIAALARRSACRGAASLQPELLNDPTFRETSVVAELDGELVGFVSAYRLPYDPGTLFIWHVEEAEAARNSGVSALMLGHLMRSDICADVTRVQTAIKPVDEPSWALFRRFARWQRAPMDIQPSYTQALTPFARHETDLLVTIRLRDAA